MTRRDLESRVQDLVDGKLAPDERAALLAEIGRDPALLEIYWGYVVLDCAFARLSRSGAFLRAEQAVITETDLRGRRKRHFRWSLAAAAAVLALIAVPLHLMFARNAPPTVTLRLSPGSVLDVSHAMAKMESPADTLMPGSRAKLDQGTFELTFASGVRAIVRGPADLTLHDRGNLFMQTGTAWFHVPAECAGFKVQTPGMTVTDLGTEFGMRTRPDSLDEVHVFRGKVEARASYGVRAAATLTANMARAAGVVGHLSEIPPDPAHFLTTLPASLPHLHWSFDDEARSATAGGSHPAAGGGTSRFAGLDDPAAFVGVAGRFGQALAATGAFAEARSGWTGVEGALPRTVAHWLKLGPGGPSAQQLVGWGTHSLTPFNPNPAFLTYLRRIKVGTVAGVSFGAYCLDGTTPLADDRWHHFAVVYTGRELADGRPELFCYLDGRAEPMTPGYRTDIGSPHAPGAYSIATKLSVAEAIPVTLFPRDWCGDGRSSNMPLALDELYIFEAALDETQVLSLYQRNEIQQQPNP
jgi:hypothetical protein